MEQPTAASMSGQNRDRSPLLRRAMGTLPWIALVILLSIGYTSVMPPSPVSRDAPTEEFSAQRAFVHVDAIAQQPHPMGTSAIAEVRAYIVRQLEGLGLSTDLQIVPARDYFGSEGLVDVVNIMARIPGTEGSGTIALMAHYDTVPATPGANDNSVAVAAALETGRALLADPPVRNDVLLLFTDAEEPAPRYGSNAFVDDHVAFADIGLVVNLETNGGSGASVLAETSGPEGWLIPELSTADPQPAAFSFLSETSRLIGDIGTDFDPFRNRGVPGLHFAYLHGSPIYHTAADNTDAVNSGSLQHHGNHALGIARHFGNLDLSNPSGDGAVFFTVRATVIHYPSAWAVPLAIATLGACVAAVSLMLRRSKTTWSAALRRIGIAVVGGLTATIAATVLWIALAALRSTPGVLESYFYLLGILTTAAWIALRLAAHQTPPAGATLLVLGLLSLITAATAPGFSYLFTWPALAGAIAVLAGQQSGVTAGWIRFLIVAIPTVVLMTPAVDIFFQFAQPRPGNPDSELTFAVALPVVLTLLSVGLLRRAWPDAVTSISRREPVAEAAAAR